MTDEKIEVIDTEVEVEETSFKDKIKDGFKKYGKKIAAVAAVAVGAGLTGYVIGHKDDADYTEADYELITDGEITDETPTEA